MQSTVRRLAFLSLAALASTLSLQAQCLDPVIGGSVGTGDDIVLPMQALGFAFPFNGQTYTHVHPCTNGFVYLSNAGIPAPGGSGCCSGSEFTLVSGSPMVAPWWTDLYIVSGTGTVNFNASPGKAVVTWNDAQEYFSSPLFTVQLQLYATGEMDFVYDSRVQNFNGHQFLVGMSQGGGAVIPPASTFSAVGASVTTTNYELFSTIGVTSMTGKGVHFVPTVPGYVWVPTNCSASHTSYGTGCYSFAAGSFYQLTPTVAASAALSNSAITLLKTTSGYVVVNGGTYVPPGGGASVLALSDDSETTTPVLTPAFPYNGGTAANLTVCSNGFVSVATGNGTSFVPDVAAMLAAPQTAWWEWHDYNPAAPGSGQVKFQQIGSIAYITWDGVYNYGGTTPADANQMQFQFDCSNGNVVIAFGNLSAIGTITGDTHLEGYSPAGSSLDPGSITFATALPITVSVDLSPLALAAAPAPISTPIIGTVVTYTTSNIPEFIPTSGLYIAMNIVSLGVIPAPGIDLGFLGAPGCAGLVASLDLTQAMVGPTSTMTVNLSIPPGVAAGTQLYSQSVALFAPFSLPNGQNAFGMETSNGVASSINSQ